VNCEDAPEFITALVDNEIPDSERALIENHLIDCARCRRAYEQEEALKAEIHKLGTTIRAPAELQERILAVHRVGLDTGRVSSRLLKK
jgi:mycothiol system anti-sigma-R factor